MACIERILLMVSHVGSNSFGSNIGLIPVVITIYGFNINIAKHTAAKSYKHWLKI